MPTVQATPQRETDIADAIKQFSNDVFRLKGDWGQVVVQANLDSAFEGIDLDGPYDQYRKFIDSAQSVAMAALTGSLQDFALKVVAIADSDESKEDKLSVAQSLLKSLNTGGPPPWTPNMSASLQKKVQAVLNACGKISSKGGELSKAVNKAQDDVSEKQAKHEENKEKIAKLIDDDHLLKQAIKTIIVWILAFVKGSEDETQTTLVKNGWEPRSNPELEKLLTEDSALMKDIVLAEQTLNKLIEKLNANKEQQDAGQILVTSLRNVGSRYIELAPKLSNICVIPTMVEAVLQSWIIFLGTDAADDKDMYAAQVNQLKQTSQFFATISEALGAFVGRAV